MTSTCIIQTDNRDPDTFYLNKTMIINKRAAKKLNYDYEFIKFECVDNIHPAINKILIINNLLKNTNYNILIFIDSDAWCNDVINLNNIVNYLVDSDKHGCYSRDPPPCCEDKEPLFTMDKDHNNTFINSGVFILKVNDFIKNMYNYLEELIGVNKNYLNKWPYDQYYISDFVYKNKKQFLIFHHSVLNTPTGMIIRHNWFKNDEMHKDLDFLIKNEIDIHYDKNVNIKEYIN
tara:strand:- start:1213 stop:1911 length:699 start_codon:yes stop_codon:yes gene_type:complete